MMNLQIEKLSRTDVKVECDNEKGDIIATFFLNEKMVHFKNNNFEVFESVFSMKNTNILK